MRRAVIGLLVLLAFPASAVAGKVTIAPPGNSGVSQYQENVPTAKGNQPSNTIAPGGGTQGPGASGGALSPSTVGALNDQGSVGRKAAALAQATAPSAARSGRIVGEPGSSPVASVVKALTGSSNGGGLGALLPIILLASLFGVAALALLRRRRST